MSPIYRIKSYYSESSVVITIEPRNQAGLMNSTSQTWLLLSGNTTDYLCQSADRCNSQSKPCLAALTTTIVRLFASSLVIRLWT
jgi:hypothetical protein